MSVTPLLKLKANCTKFSVVNYKKTYNKNNKKPSAKKVKALSLIADSMSRRRVPVNEVLRLLVNLPFRQTLKRRSAILNLTSVSPTLAGSGLVIPICDQLNSFENICGVLTKWQVDEAS